MTSHIYDIENQQELDVSSLFEGEDFAFGIRNIYSWADSANILPFTTGDYDTYFLVENLDGSFSIKSLERDVYPNDIPSREREGFQWEPPSGAILSPSGNKMLAYFQFSNPPGDCYNTVGFKSYLIGLSDASRTKLYKKCVVYFSIGIIGLCLL